MNKYGLAAIRAIELFRTGRASSPVAAWDTAVSEVFPRSPSARKKGCPRGAFLGLCGQGLIASVPKGNYSRSTRSAAYAIAAVETLRGQPALIADAKALWTAVGGATRRHNSELDVVTALWTGGLLRHSTDSEDATML